MPASASTVTSASRRTSPMTLTPRVAANWASRRPTAPFAAFWMIQSPASTSRKSRRLSALNGIATSWAAVSSLRASGTGMSPAAFATKYSLHTPKVPPVTTRWPTAGDSTPSPSASTMPTASVPAWAGSSGLKP